MRHPKKLIYPGVYFSCLRKVRYGKPHKAQQAAKRVSGAMGVKYYKYHCTNCGGYHLSKREKI